MKRIFAGMVVAAASALSPAAAQDAYVVGLTGAIGGPIEWTKDNHFRNKQYYRVWRRDPAKNTIVRVRDWTPIEIR